MLAGVQLARGYLGRPELTAERFVPDPFAGGPGSGCTAPATWPGCRRTASSSTSGRLDHQVKIRGFRIELGEIEAVLGQHPAVRDAAVVDVHHGAVGGPRLVAYLRAGRSRAGRPPGGSRRTWPSGCRSTWSRRAA